MHLFYATNIDSEFYTLNQEESKHCKVLRIKPGDLIYITDGNGMLYEAEIIDNNQHIYNTKIIKKHAEFNKRHYKLHVAIAPTKHTERFEWFLEKATEIGIDEITPLICERSEKIFLKQERLQKIILSAIKQSFTTYLPRLNSSVTFSKFTESATADQKFIAHCNDDLPHLKSVYSAKKNVIILIGPEGDFTEQEILLSKKAGYIPISLGKSRLRTETAGVFACSIINSANI